MWETVGQMGPMPILAGVAAGLAAETASRGAGAGVAIVVRRDLWRSARPGT
jgi:hypothetical protein